MMTQTGGDTRPALLTRAESGPDLSTPPLATCSYRDYRRGTGTATRITRGPLRGVALPDPRYTGMSRWPSAMLLAPGAEYFRKGLEPDVFRARYYADLEDRGAAAIAAELRQVPVEDDALVLLCFETADVETVCHRRMFAAWWESKTGVEVPELGRNTVTAQDVPLITP